MSESQKLEDVVRIPKEDIDSYSIACLRALEVISRSKPNKMVCLLRGGYPPSRVIHKLVSDYLGRNMESCLVPTSDFLRNKKDLVYALTNHLVKTAIACPESSRVFSVDTAISGSSSRQYMSDFVTNFRKILDRNPDVQEDFELNYDFVRFWNNSEDRYSKTKRRPFVVEHTHKTPSGKKGVLRFHTYDFGVRSLISEDIPLLLGLDYPIEFDKEENNGVHGKKSEYTCRVEEQKPIVVSDEEYFPLKGQSTSELFLDLLIRNSQDMFNFLRSIYSFRPGLAGNPLTPNPSNPYRENLQTLRFPPYLVDFCGELKFR